MKRHLLRTKLARTGVLFGVIIYFLTIVLASLSVSLIKSGTASASGEQYLLYYDPANAGAIKQAFSGSALGPSPNGSAFNDTSVYAKGGVFGNTPFAFTYDSTSGIFSSANGTVTYNSNATLDCKITQDTPGNTFMKTQRIQSPLPLPYTVHIPLDLQLNLSPADIISGPNTAHQIVTGKLSIGGYNNIGVTYGFQGTNRTTTLSNYLNNLNNAPSQFGSSVGDITSMLAQNCLPGGMNITHSGNSLASYAVSSAAVRLLNWPALSSSAQSAWPGVQSSTDIINGNNALNNPNNPNTPSPPSLSCNISSFITGFNLSSILNSVNPLNWLFCGLIDGAAGIVNGLDKSINSSLSLGNNGTSDDPNNIFADPNGSCGPSGNSQNCKDYETAWSSFKNIALGLLAIAGLIIVISQALGMEILDAYTIRKMLPRVLIAAIGITLSWQLMRFAVKLSNDLGYGVGSLMWSPFSTLHASINLGGANSLMGGLAVAIGGTTIGFFGLLTFLGTAALAVIIAFLTLTIRQIVVIALVILSPIALIAYVLPNTQRTFRLWWESFSKLLLMFPLIVLLITTGQIFAAISSQNPNFTNQVIALLAYFGPYFMIPATFRFSGGIMSAAGGFVNSSLQPGMQALRGIRSNQTKGNIAALAKGTRFKGSLPGTQRLANAANEASKGVAAGWTGRFGLGARGRRARRNIDQAAGGEAGQGPGMQAISGYNDANRILAMGMGNQERGRQALFNHLMSEKGDDGKALYTEEQARAKVEAAAVAAKVSGGWTKANGIAAFNNMVRDGTAIRDTDDLANLAAIAGQGDRNNTFKYAAEGASISRQVGRPDLAAASEPIGELAFAKSDQMYNKTGNARLYTGGEELSTLSDKAWLSGAGGEVAYTKFGSAKGRAVRNDTRRAVDIMKAHRQAVESGQRSPHSDEIVQMAAATLVDSKNAIEQNYGKVNNRDDARKEMEKDEGALDWYLGNETTVIDTQRVEGPNPTVGGAPVYASSPRRTTNEEVVKKIVGDRYASLTPAQREAAQRQATTEDNDQNQNP